MKQIIQDLTKMLNDSDNIEAAAKELQKSEQRFAFKAALNVMKDIQEHADGLIDETQLSLYLYQNGFRG